ncbi:DNA primase [Flavobacterium sp. MFBS3-15]|uniref:DNA primase n=1 Tax=Flavobacterium sp. MFBS3-15 TaxID=2989816 RepID=UPI0022367FF5|nr:DNA primase [Flavobacterium sp. MFBS3-15]MCW4470809.1 DNA primase [Flavobacterium sp. MFBS3-15]
MKRVIVDYAKLTNEILTLLVEKFPEGYDDSNIVRFKNAKNETIEAVEVRTEDTIYLVKVSTKLADRIENFDDDDIDEPADDLDALKDLEMGDDDADEKDDTADADTDDDADGDDDEDEDEDGMPRRNRNVGLDELEEDDEDDEE